MGIGEDRSDGTIYHLFVGQGFRLSLIILTHLCTQVSKWLYKNYIIVYIRHTHMIEHCLVCAVYIIHIHVCSGIFHLELGYTDGYYPLATAVSGMQPQVTLVF